MGGDPSFGSLHQPIRIAGTVNRKHGGNAPVRIVEVTSGEYHLADLAERVAALPDMPGLVAVGRAPHVAAPGSRNPLPERPIRAGGVDGVTRFDALSRVIGVEVRRMRLGRCTEQQAWAAVVAFNATRVQPPWDAARLRREFDALTQLDRQKHGVAASSVIADGASTALPAVRSDDALALALAADVEGDLLSIPELGQWRIWSGQHWQKDTTGIAQERSRDLCRRAAAQVDGSEARRVASQKTIAAVQRLASTDPRIAVSVDMLDAHDMLLNTPCGVVDLTAGEVRPNDPALLMTRLTSVGPGGDCPRWRRFLDEITGGDADLVAYLARLLGYCLTGLTREQVFAFFVGTGANGKSVLLQTVARVLGDYVATAAPDTFAESRGNRHLSELAGLRGARLVLVAETHEGQAWDEARIKTVTGGDGLRVNFMRQDHFEFRPTFKLIVAGNHRPRLTGTGEAMRRRLHVVPFDVTIPPDQRDPHLPETLAKEGPGILSWLIQGCLQWQRIDLAPPPRVRLASQDYIEAEDVVGEWLRMQCVFGPDRRARAGDLYRNWKQWAEREGHPVGSQKALGEALRSHGFRQARTGAVRHWVGVDLRRDASGAAGDRR